MHASTAQMMAMANSFWPLAYSLKSYDFSVHPAFLPTSYRNLPSLSYAPTNSPQTTSTSPLSSTTSSPPQKSSNKFSIDAILNKNKRSESPSSVNSEDDIKKYTQTYSESGKIQEADLSRRHQRLFEAAHPYFGHMSTLHDFSHQSQQQHHHHQHQQKTLTSAYSHITENTRAPGVDKCEKKSSPIAQSWSKQGKGKRVRTIFTPEQLERMEAEFERQQYMVGTERYYLASSLNLTEAQVKVWFQNRRIKWRKQHLEQQKARLNSIDIYRHAESGSDSESDDDGHNISDVRGHMESLSDPFQSPREARVTQ